MFSQHLHVLSFTADQKKCAACRCLQNCVRFRFESREKQQIIVYGSISFRYSAATVLHFQRCSRCIALLSFLFNINILKSCCLFGCLQSVAVACRPLPRSQPVSSRAVSPRSALKVSLITVLAAQKTESLLRSCSSDRTSFLPLQKCAYETDFFCGYARAAQTSPR